MTDSHESAAPGPDAPPAFEVDDLVLPAVGGAGVTPKRIERVITTYEDDFDQPLERPDYIVNGVRFAERELRPAHGQKREPTDG